MRIKNLENHFNNTIVALVILLIYMLIASILLPFGVNFLFTFQAMIWVLSLIALSFILFISIIFLLKEKPLEYLTKDKSLFSFKKIERFELKDFVLLILPMTPIFQYVILNNDILSIIDYIIIMLFFAMLVIVFAYIVPWALSIIASRKVLTIVSLSFLFVIFNMPLLSESSNWYHQGSLLVQSSVLVFTIALLLSLNFASKKLLYTFIIVFFLFNITASALGLQGVSWRDPQQRIYPIEMAMGGHKNFHKNEELLLTMEKHDIVNNNDIMLLVYESYANYETMKHYGFDNSGQIAFLENNDFHVYHGVYSLGAPSLPAMSQVFNIERKVADRKFVVGDGAVHTVLAKKGYTNLGIFQSDFFFRGLSIDDIKYDDFFPVPSSHEGSKLLIDAILIGMFTDKISIERASYESFLEQKRNVLTEEYLYPVFKYSHSARPGHRDTSSQCPDDVDKDIDIYINNVKKANVEMIEDISLLLRYNPDAIIIIAGDHGPFLTKTGYGVHDRPNDYCADDIDRLDIQDRYGAFLAIRWPDEIYSRRHDIQILQDIFPAVFAYIYDDESLFEKTRIHKRTTVGKSIFGVYVEDGIIVGGKDDGNPLFEGIQ